MPDRMGHARHLTRPGLTTDLPAPAPHPVTPVGDTGCMTFRNGPVPMESQDDPTSERIDADIRARIEALGERRLVPSLLDQG